MFGIRIGVDPSWFFVLFLWIWLLSSSFKDVLGPGQENRAFALATVSALLFFVSVVLHELGHAVVARRNGMEVAGVTLWMFGGVAALKGEMPSAGAEFRMAAAGPLVTVAVIVGCYLGGIALVGSHEFAQAATLKRGSSTSSAALLLSWLMNVNLFVLVINLIPAYPLDGGRMLRALAWWRTGDRNKATRFAARLGRGFGYLLMAGGIAWTAAGDVWGLWLALIGWMLSRWARAEEAQGAVLSRLEGLRVSDVMDAEPVAIDSRTKLDRAEDEYFLRYGWAWFPVIDQPGHVLGVLTKGKVDQVPASLRNEYTADQVMISDPGTFKVDASAPLETLLQTEGLAQLGAVMAVDAEGVLRGIVTADQVRRALRPEPA